MRRYADVLKQTRLLLDWMCYFTMKNKITKICYYNIGIIRFLRRSSIEFLSVYSRKYLYIVPQIKTTDFIDRENLIS